MLNDNSYIVPPSPTEGCMTETPNPPPTSQRLHLVRRTTVLHEGDIQFTQYQGNHGLNLREQIIYGYDTV